MVFHTRSVKHIKIEHDVVVLLAERLRGESLDKLDKLELRGSTPREET